jgi:hypothetical protein
VGSNQLIRMIKRFFIGITLCFFVISAFSQQNKSIKFDQETHDFGTIAEEKGSVTHEFTFTNNSARPVKILNVQPSCGCTTPGWTKEPIEPGKTGIVKASFNPQGRPGFFTKSLTVTTDLEASPIILQIKGQVTNDGQNMAGDFSIVNGALKFRTSSFNLGKVFIRDEFTTREFPVYNGGTKTITFNGNFITPKHIKVDVQPRILAQGEKGIIRISYNGKMKNQYGFQSDNVELPTDDETNPVKSFSVYATLEDYFGDLSPTDMEKAPVMRVNEYSIDFGRIKGDAATTKEVTVMNAGKKELSLRSLQPNCTCVKANASKTTLKPGESATVKIAFDPMGRNGSQQKAVTIYSNDPVNPVQRVTFTAYVE